MAENTKIEVAPTLLAYLAGMIDGDGYISIVRSVRAGKEYYGAQIGIAGTRPDPHKLAASIWGGVVSRYEPANPNHRAQYQWSRQGAQAAVVIMAVMPRTVGRIFPYRGASVSASFQRAAKLLEAGRHHPARLEARRHQQAV